MTYEHLCPEEKICGNWKPTKKWMCIKTGFYPRAMILDHGNFSPSESFSNIWIYL